MPVYQPYTKRYADPETTKTPIDKAPDPGYGSDFIPAERYTSAEFAQKEWDHVWTKVWLLGAYIGDLENPGDYVVTEIGNQSIVITKDEHGQFNAFHNVCSHRGNQVAYQRTGNTQNFRCSYHAWVYNLGGELIHVPDEDTFPAGAPCDDLSIVKLPCDVWGVWVWCSLNPDVEPLREFLREMPEHLDPYHFDRFALVQDDSVLWECNWKTSVDAFNESYHVLETHPQIERVTESLHVQIDCYEKHSRYLIPFGNPDSHLQDQSTVDEAQMGWMQRFGADPTGFNGEAPDIRRYMQENIRAQSEARGYDLSDMNDDQLTDDYHYHIFPNITFNCFYNGFSMFRQRPHETDPNKMYFDLQQFVLIPKRQAWPERPAHRSFKNGEIPYSEVYEQDAANCEKQQKGFHSLGFRGLWLSDQELRVKHLHKVLDDYIDKDLRC
ncbi:MAG: aromatic ring-hydroxylating dioxygenase subunit alpha [Gammaproteobacteria bacterium]|nr:aromatic ring-hydroxylating dioxygenase subunit alpha [Gammaproteobacteria bacterium]